MRSMVAAAVLALAGMAHPADLGRWDARAPMGVPRQEIGVAVIGTSLYAVAGFDAQAATAVVERWDAATDTWIRRAPLPVALHHVGAAAVGGVLYAIGGLDGAFEGVDTVFAYDPAADAWTSRAPLPRPRGAMGVTVVDGRIFAAGGLRNGVSVDDFAVYDPPTDVWTPLPPMPTARDHLAADTIGGLVYAVGGRDADALRSALERFDPATAQWTSLPPLPTPRGGLMAAALGGRLYAFGGEGNPDHPSGVFSQTEAFDPARTTWTVLAPMATPRHGTVAVAIDGAIHVPGGATRQGFGVSAAHDAFVPPATDPLRVRRLRVDRRGRFRLRATLAGLPATIGDAAVTLTVTAPDGAAVLTLALPSGSLGSTRRGFAHRTGDLALRFVSRRTAVVLRVRASGAVRRDGPLAVRLELGDLVFAGTAVLR